MELQRSSKGNSSIDTARSQYCLVATTQGCKLPRQDKNEHKLAVLGYVWHTQFTIHVYSFFSLSTSSTKPYIKPILDDFYQEFCVKCQSVRNFFLLGTFSKLQSLKRLHQEVDK